MFDFNPDAFHEQYDTAIMITSTINLKKKSHGFEMGPWPLASKIGGAKKADECQNWLQRHFQASFWESLYSIATSGFEMMISMCQLIDNKL